MMEMTEENASYIGDGVYAGFDEMGGIWLHANDYANPTDKIYLEPQVFYDLIKFAERRFKSRSKT